MLARAGSDGELIQDFMRPPMRALWLAALVTWTSCSSGRDGPDAGNEAARAGYSACQLIGGYDRLFVFRADSSRGTCTRLVLASPASFSAIPLTVPQGWGVQEASISNQASDCGKTGASGSAVAANGGTGAIDWMPPQGFPSQLAAHATLTFPQSGWVPAMDGFDADAIIVSPCR